MRVFRLLLPALALCFLAMGERPPTFTVRFHAEANSRDTEAFSMPIKIGNPPHDAFLEKVAMLNERQIDAIFPYHADDGTWGCAFRLDHDGRINLEVISTQRRGTVLVGFIATKKGNHRLPDLIIDRTVRDGIINVPSGLTDTEIAILGKQFKVLGNVQIPTVSAAVKAALKNDGPPKEKKSWNPFRKKPAAPEGAPTAQ